MTPGAKIKTLRLQQGLTQEDFAAAIRRRYPNCAITRENLVNWENNRHMPHWQKAKPLVKYLGITLDNLFFNNQTDFLKQNKKHLKKA